MKYFFKIFYVLPLIFLSCLSSPCPEDTWCDSGETMDYHTITRNLETNNTMNGIINLHLTYNKSSELFELQVILEGSQIYNFNRGQFPTIEIRGGQWTKEEILENVDLSLNTNNDKILFKSSILENTLKSDDEREDPYGIYLKQKSPSNPNWVSGDMVRIIWGMW